MFVVIFENIRPQMKYSAFEQHSLAGVSCILTFEIVFHHKHNIASVNLTLYRVIVSTSLARCCRGWFDGWYFLQRIFDFWWRGEREGRDDNPI